MSLKSHSESPAISRAPKQHLGPESLPLLTGEPWTLHRTPHHPLPWSVCPSLPGPLPLYRCVRSWAQTELILLGAGLLGARSTPHSDEVLGGGSGGVSNTPQHTGLVRVKGDDGGL